MKEQLPDLLLAHLAAMYYQKHTPKAITQAYSAIPPEIIELADRGLVEIEDAWVVGDKRAKLTTQGEEQLRAHGVSRIIQALQSMKWFLSMEFYVEMLPRDALPEFLVHNVNFIRGTAMQRFRELGGVSDAL